MASFLTVADLSDGMAGTLTRGIRRSCVVALDADRLKNVSRKFGGAAATSDAPIPPPVPDD
jgi:hypothetical protein